MTANYYFGWGSTLLFILVGIVFLLVPIAGGWLLRPRTDNPHKSLTYECGEEAIGDSWIRFNPRYYVIALVFVLFDVEIIFMYPWAVAYGNLRRTHVLPGFPQVDLGVALLEMLLFLGILIIGFAYLWRYGYLEWITTLSTEPAED